MTAEEIISRVAERNGITTADLRGPSQERRMAHPRQEAMARLQIELGWSTPRIGRALGGRHHTTVLHGVRAYTDRLRAKLREKGG